ncbi:MAG: hypothetical protein IT196_02220 [Acidimicrobiales bacterium]|nr:hypothetical protein [Acidimicrobiales bacterium]
MDTGPHPVLPATRRSSRRTQVRETSVDELFAFSDDDGPVHPLQPVHPVGSAARGPRPGATATHAATGAHAATAIAAAEAPLVVIDEQEEDPDQLTVGGPLLPSNVRGGPGGRVRRTPRDGVEAAGVAAARVQSGHLDRSEDRLRVVADVNGPRIRLGLAWFLAAGAALLLSHYLAAAVFAVVAVAGAIQSATALRRYGHRTNPYLAGACAGLVTVAAVAPSSTAVGLAVLISVVASLISGLHIGGFDLDSSADTIRSWLAIALACAGPVVFARYETALGVLLFLLVCSYDAGDFLVGTASSNSFEGPLAGLVGVLAVGCGAAILHPGGLAQYDLWPAVLAAAVACPIGQLLGSVTLPAAGAFAPALRRVDSLIAVSAIWLVLFA